MRRIAIIVGTLAALLWALVLAQPAAAQRAVSTTGTTTAITAADVHLSKSVPHARWFARCKSRKAISADSITTAITYTRPRVWVWSLTKTQIKKRPLVGWQSCYVLGEWPSKSGYTALACHGPTAMRDAMKADSATCSDVVAWDAVSKLADTKLRDWIAERSTCCGEATHHGRTYRAWPCSRTDLTVSRLDGYGPGVVAGTDPCEAYPPPEDVP